VADLREYAEVLERLVDGPACSSSVSGAARFLPFKSREGSLMVREIDEVVFRRLLKYPQEMVN